MMFSERECREMACLPGQETRHMQDAGAMTNLVTGGCIIEG